MAKIFSVGDLNRYLKSILDNELTLHNIQITGEISNLTKHSTGHWYFSMKDEEGNAVKAVMFRFSVASIPLEIRTTIKEGSKVIVTADVDLYVKSGSYQINVKKLSLVGAGTLYEEFEKLKTKLEAEGLFAQARKKIIPRYCNNLGVITAPTGAAIHDILTTVKRRWPQTSITLIPSLVQGEGAKEALVNALQTADKLGFDVIIFGRGGGSIEDLWAFNEECVARQLFIMKTPVISAVGHEPDVTISDYVADFRAATPTAGAEMATPNKIDVINQLQSYKSAIYQSSKQQIEMARKNLAVYQKAKVLIDPTTLYSSKVLELDSTKAELLKSKEVMFNQIKVELNKMLNRINTSLTSKISKQEQDFKVLVGQLNAMNPLNILQRGYGIAMSEDTVIDSISKIAVNQTYTLRLKDGLLHSIVTKKEEK